MNSCRQVPSVSEPLNIPDETRLFPGHQLPFVHPDADQSGFFRVEAISNQDALELPRAISLL